MFGDSITWGAWDPDGGGWVRLLALEGFDRQGPDGSYIAVYNRGVSGDALSDVIRRFDVECDAIKPQVVVIAIGINDAAHNGRPNTEVATFTASYNALVENAYRRVEDVVLVTPTNVDERRPEHDYRNRDIEPYVAAVRSCAKQRHLPLVDVFGAMTTDDLAPDGLHPGGEGHRRLYEAVSPVVFTVQALADV